MREVLHATQQLKLLWNGFSNVESVSWWKSLIFILKIASTVFDTNSSYFIHLDKGFFDNSNQQLLITARLHKDLGT